jgi:hypothetical protein
MVCVNLTYMVALYAHGTYQTKLILSAAVFLPANLIMAYMLVVSVHEFISRKPNFS